MTRSSAIGLKDVTVYSGVPFTGAWHSLCCTVGLASQLSLGSRMSFSAASTLSEAFWHSLVSDAIGANSVALCPDVADHFTTELLPTVLH